MNDTPAATTEQAPLAGYRIIGITENAIRRADGTTAAGGTCWHCGTGIRYEVHVQHTATGERHTIGQDCAKRVGMNRTELREYLASFYAEERSARSAAARAEHAAREAHRAAVLGEHGTAERLGNGCLCEPCRQTAPHGHRVRFDLGCRCDECLAAAIEFYDGSSTRAQLIVRDRLVLCTLTGEIADAKIVSTRYGARWCVNDGAEWLPVEPARRSTLARKGYTEAEVPVLMWTGTGRDGRPYYTPVMALAAPLTDTHGERF